MYYIPPDDEILPILQTITKNPSLSSFERNIMSQSPFSHVETLKMPDSDKMYVFKSVSTYLQEELLIHTLVSDYEINAAKIHYHYKNRRNKHYYFIMDFLDEIKPLYMEFNIEDEVFFDLINQIADFHVVCKDFPQKYLGKLTHYGPKFYQKYVQHYIPQQVNQVFALQEEELPLSDDIQIKFLAMMLKLPKMFESIENCPLTLVHGDLNIGNIIMLNEKVRVIDWGMAHIDSGIIDIGHFTDSIGDISESIRSELVETYFSKAKGLYPKNLDINDALISGKIMHLLYYINFQCLATLEKWVPHDYFYQQLYHEIVYVMGLIQEIMM